MLTTECAVTEMSNLIQEYTGTLSSPIDSYLERHIVNSTFYVFLDGMMQAGYYAVYNNELLTQFYVSQAYQKHAQEMFNQVLRNHSVKAIFVPTCDELFLSLAVDKDFKITKQAYFFQDSKVELPQNDSLKDTVFRQAMVEDALRIKEVCGDFLDRYERRIEHGELFTYYRGSILLGIGVVEKSNILDGLASIGMFTNQIYRKQGIGRNIILKLKKWCYSQDLTPISGCGYNNEASKRTLESAGMVSRTRLLKIKLDL